MSMVWDALKSAKHDKTSLSAIWLDVANAYGSVPHRLIYFALKRYGVSEKWIKIIQKYYREFGVSVFKNFHHLAGTITNEVFSLVVQSQLYCFLQQLMSS